jgi:hypothetical protein
MRWRTPAAGHAASFVRRALDKPVALRHSEL